MSISQKTLNGKRIKNLLSITTPNPYHNTLKSLATEVSRETCHEWQFHQTKK